MKQIIKYSFLSLLMFSIFAATNINCMHKYHKSKKTKRMRRRTPKKIPRKKVNPKFLKKQKRQQTQSIVEKEWKKLIASLLPRKKSQKSNIVTNHSKIYSSEFNPLLKIFFMFIFIFNTAFADVMVGPCPKSSQASYCTKLFKMPSCEILEKRLIHDEIDPHLRFLYKGMGIVEKVCQKEMTLHQLVENVRWTISKHRRKIKKTGQIEKSVPEEKLYQIHWTQLVPIRKILKNNPDAMAIIENNAYADQWLWTKLKLWVEDECDNDDVYDCKNYWGSFLTRKFLEPSRCKYIRDEGVCFPGHDKIDIGETKDNLPSYNKIEKIMISEKEAETT